MSFTHHAEAFNGFDRSSLHLTFRWPEGSSWSSDLSSWLWPTQQPAGVKKETQLWMVWGSVPESLDVLIKNNFLRNELRYILYLRITSAIQKCHIRACPTSMMCSHIYPDDHIMEVLQLRPLQGLLYLLQQWAGKYAQLKWWPSSNSMLCILQKSSQKLPKSRHESMHHTSQFIVQPDFSIESKHWNSFFLNLLQRQHVYQNI